MSEPSEHQGELTALLARWDDDAASRDRALAVVYHELRHMAAGLLSGNPRGVTLQATALVNEALMKLLGQSPSWENRSHFFGVAARAMRQILVDYARRRLADKRGGGAAQYDFELALDVPAEDRLDLLALDQALQRLEQLDPGQVRIVELRYFVGLSIEEAAATLGLHPSAVKREWTMARAWLKQELNA